MGSDEFKNIPGVPEGWELVRIDNPTHGEWFIDGVGLPKQYPYKNPCGGKFPIIREIEKQLCPFNRKAQTVSLANAREAARLLGLGGV